jgi:hypothetical protein
MNKFIIGIAIVVLFAGLAVTANAAIQTKSLKRVVVKAKDYITQNAKSLGNALWDNKGAVAVGTVAAVALTSPEPVIQGATTIITGKPAVIASSSVIGSSSATGGLWYYGFYLAITILCIVGVRCAWNYVKDYKNWLPLMIVGVFLCCGDIVEAGIITPPPPVLPPIPWLALLNIAAIVISIFI